MKSVRIILFLIFLVLVPRVLLAEVSDIPHTEAFLKPFQASPDQVLVLYNAEWPKDVDGSEPGQD